MSMVRGSQRKTSLRGPARCLAVGLLVALGASAAQAGPPVPCVATGPILGIDAGEVKPAGRSGRFVVKERTITGLLFGAIGGVAGEPFSFTFHTNVPIMTQSGQIQGTLVAGGTEAKINATSQIGLTPIACESPDGVTCVATPTGNFVPGLLFSGTFSFTEGMQGQGQVSGWLIPEIDPTTGHIVGVIAGNLTLTGQCQP